MTKFKIQNLKSLEAEMKAVGRGEKRAPPDAAQPSFESVKALARVGKRATRERDSLLARKNHRAGTRPEDV